MVAIFWDYENCPLSTTHSGHALVNRIRDVAHTFGVVTHFRAYLDVSEQSSSPKCQRQRADLQSSGVSIIDCPHNGKKEVVDEIIMVDMLVYAMDQPPPATVILISGDRDYAYMLSMLRNRQYRVVIIGHHAHPSLKSQATMFLDWNTEVVGKVVVTFPRSRESSPLSLPSPSPLLSPLVEISREEIDFQQEDYYLVASGQESDFIEPFPPVPIASHDFRPQTNDSASCYVHQLPALGLDDAIGPESAMVALSTGMDVDSSVDEWVFVSLPDRPEHSASTHHVKPPTPPPMGLATAIFTPPKAIPTASPPRGCLSNGEKVIRIPPENSVSTVQITSDNPANRHAPTPTATSSLSVQSVTAHTLPPSPPTVKPKAQSPPPTVKPKAQSSPPGAKAKVTSPPGAKAKATSPPPSAKPKAQPLKGTAPTPSPISTSRLPTSSTTRKAPPQNFASLVNILRGHRARGSATYPRSKLACELTKSIYGKAGCQTFGAYTRLAERKKIVLLGGVDNGGDPWIALCSDWQ